MIENTINSDIKNNILGLKRKYIYFDNKEDLLTELEDDFNDEYNYDKITTEFNSNNVIESYDIIDDSKDSIEIIYDISDHFIDNKLIYSDNNNIIINMLPKDLILRSLSYLCDFHDYYNCSMVNKYLCNVMADDSVWNYLYDKKFIQLNKIINHKEFEAVTIHPISESISPWICSSCLLIQALSTSISCEFCLTPRDLTIEINNNSLPYIIISSPQQFSKIWTEGRKSNESTTVNDNNNHSNSNNIHYHPTHYELQNKLDNEIKDYHTWSYYVGLPIKPSMYSDYIYGLPSCKLYTRCKIEFQSTKYRNLWDDLGSGWIWIITELKHSIRNKLSTSLSINTYNNLYSNNNKQDSMKLSRLLQKLISKNWKLCYECLYNEMLLQAQSIVYDLIALFSINNINDNVNVYLNYINVIIKICEVYLIWCEEIEDHTLKLTNHIVNQQDLYPNNNHNIDSYSIMLLDLSLIILKYQVFLNHRIVDEIITCIDNIEVYIDISNDINVIDRLLLFYDLLQLIDIADDNIDSNNNKDRYHRLYIIRLQSIVSIAKCLRDRTNIIDQQVSDINRIDNNNIQSLMEIFEDSNHNDNKRSYGIINRLAVIRRFTQQL